jgi:hypothetical protein
MTVKPRIALLTLAAGLVGTMILAQIAGATHPRPKGATPLRVPLVPAYDQCTTPNRTHGPPLAFPSCNPPAQSSSAVTVGSQDANGAPANSEGFFKITVIVDAAGPPDGSDLVLASRITDARCRPGTTACGNANAADGADYVGELQSDAPIRITDHFNAVSAGGGPDPATVVDIPFPVKLFCSNTANTSIGGDCTIHTSYVTMCACNPWFEGRRVAVEMAQFQVFDGGPDGLTSTQPEQNDVFMRQGLFIP